MHKTFSYDNYYIVQNNFVLVLIVDTITITHNSTLIVELYQEKPAGKTLNTVLLSKNHFPFRWRFFIDLVITMFFQTRNNEFKTILLCF